jgi:ABC-type multidrug transport system fused ATPase/permease subunit
MKDIIEFAKEIIYILGSDIRKIPLMLVFFIISSLLDIIGIGLVIPYISIMLDPSDTTYSKYFFFINTWQPDNLLIFIGIIMVIVFFFKMISAIGINKMILKFSYDKGAQLRANLMDYYQKALYIEHIKRNSASSKYTILMLSLQFAQGSMQAILRLFSEIFIVLAIFVLLAWNAGLILSVFVLIIGGILLIYNLYTRNKLINYGTYMDNNSKRLIQGIDEAIDGLKEIRILGKEAYFYNKVKSTAEGVANAGIKTAVIKTIPRFLLEFSVILFIVIFVSVSILLNSEMTHIAALLAMFGVATIRLVPSVNKIFSGIMQLNSNRNAVHLLYLDLKSIKISPALEKRHNAVKHLEFRNITLNDVNYAYPGVDKNVLNDISLSINAGDSIGFIGESGSGKSTLIDLLLGFLEPDKGTLLFNGGLLSDNIDIWRENVAYLPQQIFLTDNTMRSNIALGIDSHKIDDRKIMRALDKSQLSNFVQTLPDGLNTMLGEKGVRLSGGQKQRIALARAFYHDRNVLVMDESTSALDDETESEIVEEIRQLKGIKTVIVIAHRLTTLKYCDQIYRLDNGKIVEHGSYDSVVNKTQ